MSTERHPFVDALLANSNAADDALTAFRGRSREQLESRDVPGRKAEEWRFFDLRRVVDTEWSVTNRGSFDTTTFSIDESATSRLVFQNGAFATEASSIELPDGVFAASLADLPDAERGAALDALGSATAAYDDDPFTAANGAFAQDVAAIVVPADTVVEQPFHVLFVGGDADTMQCPRLIVVAGRGSKFTVVEDYRSGSEDAYFTNAVSEFIVGESANVHHVRVQRENVEARHIARVGARVSRFAKYDSVHVTLGANSSRNDVWVTHEGEDGWSRLDGLAMVGGDAETDTHTVIDNTKPRCESHQLHKCVVDDKAHAVFNGKIFVRQDAQKIDAYQLNRNLLLSTRARVHTKPQLEIWADDVQCTHGATVGQLDDEQLFYLQSRGLSEHEARATLTYAFAAEVIDSIQVPSLAETLENEARQRTMR